ncbi:MAG TPA: hypothetical protein PK020_18765 [Ilumatobacteraceae bacterium]|nr:hypothetical protein [Ilumatobacteraceae bacterium]
MFDIFGYRDGPGGQPVVALLNVAMQQWTAKPRQTPAPQPAVVQFTLNAPASVTATIVEPPDCAPSTGGGDSCRSYPQCQTVRTLTANYAMAGTYSLSWDGYGEPVGQPPQSQIVSGTAFRIDLLATNGMQSHQVPDLVNRVEIPRPGNANSGWNDVDFDPYANRGITITPPVPAGLSPTTPVLVRTRHELLPNNFTVFHPVVAVSALPATFTWDGRGPDGVIIPTSTHAIICDYAVFPTLVAVSQGLPTLVGQGNGSAPWLEVKADPFALTHSYDQVSSIRYRLNEAASVTIRLLPPGVVPNETNFNSTAAISLIESQARQANTDYAEAYTGFLLQDLNRIRTGDEGQFNFMIRATSNATGAVATYRGALHLSR